ncbi:MAG: hypothetical protein K2O65_01015 [Lachnospiraceae bacterium]|nr:hypothetical protein [Lachnospiraceae bacterium]
MAETKKTAIAKPVAKAVAAQPADTKTEEAKTTTAAPAAETKKTAKKTTTRKTTAKKAPAKKTAAEKKTTAKKEAVKATFNLQFAGKSYTTEDLVKIAKDVWKYDLNQKAGDFKTVELYVKPEENVVYYVINGDVTGNFGI